MQKYEQYKRMLRFLLSLLFTAAQAGVFYCTWMACYNGLMESPFQRKGNWLMAAFYTLLILLFAHMYSGWRIGALKAFHLIWSQSLSLLFADAVIYLVITLLTKRFQTFIPLLAMSAAQCVFTALWGMASTACYLRAYPPRRVLMVYGDRPNLGLVRKFHSREDRYIICETIHISEGMERITERIREYEGVVIGDIPTPPRNRILKYCYETSVRTYTSPKISDILIRSAESQHLFDTPILLSRNSGLTFEQRVVKRAADIVFSLAAVVLLSPLMALTALAVKLEDGGPALFKQKRATLNGRVFEVLKFRSMVVDAEREGAPVPATGRDARITKVGRIIRACRIDELPQLFNILKGEMSLVGPRPERLEHVEKYSRDIPEFPYRLKVKGGLTGYAQVYGKYNTTAYDKLKLDLTYIQNYSLRLDIEILFQTVRILFMKESTEGFSEETSTAMTDYSKSRMGGGA